jgi:hypothetical protein
VIQIVKKLIGFCLLILVSGGVFADNLGNPDINLFTGSVDVGPTQVRKISLDKLVSGFSYKVTCKITDPNNQNNKVPMLFSTDNMFPVPMQKFSLNGVDISSQAYLPMKDNILVAVRIGHDSTYLNFANADQTDSVSISNCVAIPENQ